MKFSSPHSMLFIALLLLTAAGASSVFAQSSSFDANLSAQQLSDQVGAKLGSSSGIGQNAVNPLTAGSPMTSMTGTIPFYAPNMSCPSSNNYLTVTIVPDNVSGDIANLYVQQDTNFDNSFDYSYTAPVRVSGVCGNGVISCDAGTWNNCQYFKWSADSNGKASLVSCVMQDLGGCFCVNNGCGSSIVTNEMDYILSVLGGGIAGALQAVNPKWAVSTVSSSFMQISYTGQNIDNCVAPATNFSSGTANPQQHYNGGQGSLDSAAQTEVSAQLANPGSAYNAIQSISAAASSAGTVASCSLTNSAAVSTVMVPTTNPISYTFYATVDNYFNLYLDGTLLFSGTDWRTTYTQTLLVSPGNHTLKIDATDTGGGYMGVLFALRNNGDGTWPAVSDNSWSPVNANYGTVGVGPWGFPSGWPEASAQWIWGNGNPITVSKTFNAVLVISTDTLTDPVATDNCVSMETNTQCSLQNEVVDGVQTFLNYNPTGLAPIASCRDFTGMFQLFHVCHNWWSKSRTYYCNTATAFDFTAIKARSANISTSSTAGGGTVTYQDKTPGGSGGWLYSSNTFSMDTSSGPAGCMTACKTKKPSFNTQASLSGNTAQTNTSTSAWQFSFKTCISSSGSLVCPLSTGELIVTDCQCINDFAESATIMETLNDASKGMICSSGTQAN